VGIVVVTRPWNPKEVLSLAVPSAGVVAPLVLAWLSLIG